MQGLTGGHGHGGSLIHRLAVMPTHIRGSEMHERPLSLPLVAFGTPVVSLVVVGDDARVVGTRCTRKTFV